MTIGFVYYLEIIMFVWQQTYMKALVWQLNYVSALREFSIASCACYC